MTGCTLPHFIVKSMDYIVLMFCYQIFKYIIFTYQIWLLQMTILNYDTQLKSIATNSVKYSHTL